jgi:HK97 family phage major capsid protein
MIFLKTKMKKNILTNIETLSEYKECLHFLKTGKISNVEKFSVETKDWQETCSGDDCKNGGYLVSQILNNEIITIAEEANIFRQLARVKQITGNRNEYLYVSDKIGELGWVGETDNRPATKTPTIEKIVIKLFEMYTQPRVTQDLLNDSISDIYSWLRDEISDALSTTELSSVLRGNGISSPVGLFSNEARLEKVLTKEVNKISLDDIINLYNSLDPKYRNNACFVMNPIMQNAIYINIILEGNFISQYSFIDKTPNTLFGLPVYLCNQMDIGTETGDMPIIFGDFRKGYMIIDCPSSFTFIRDDITEKQWVKFYTSKRVGTSVIDGNALKILKVK